MFSKNTYIERRENLKKSVVSGLLLFLGNEDQGLNYADNAFRYRQDSTFLYFFGIHTASIAAIIDIDNNKEIIFGDELSIDAIVWMGNQESLHDKGCRIGIEDVRPYSELKRYLDNAVSKSQNIHYLPTYRSEHQVKLLQLLSIGIGEEKPSTDFIKGVVNLRNYKSKEEIEQIKIACDITADMHIEAIKALRPGMRESEIAAVIEYVALKNNANLSFPTIATRNGQTLHNHFHGNIVKSGDLVLIDAGAETDMGYAGDMSSTFPADKKFSDIQRTIYTIQNRMHVEAVKALRPGVRFEDVYNLSAKVMVEDLKSLNLMKGDAEEAVIAGAHAMFFPCGLGHMMGLDVHDMENLGEVWVGYNGKAKSTQFGRKSLRLARELEPGFVLTVEPGIYFIPELIDKWKAERQFEDFINYTELEKYKGFGGIRNEEDFLITETGYELLGKKTPLTPEEVEALR